MVGEVYEVEPWWQRWEGLEASKERDRIIPPLVAGAEKKNPHTESWSRKITNLLLQAVPLHLLLMK